MKRHFGEILTVALLFVGILAGFTSCGASESMSADYRSDDGYSDGAYGEYSAESEVQNNTADLADASKGTSDEKSGLVQSNAGEIDTDKIIRTANTEIETVDFTKAVEKVNQLASGYNGYFDSTSIGGRSYEQEYYGYDSYRTASFTMRVPKENFAALTDALSEVGNVLNTTTTAENVTGQYTDTESRLKTYRTEEERLLSMLEKAETVEDMLNIEDRLAMVRYEIESLTASLKQLDNKIYYCTVYITLREVRRYTEVEEVKVGYWEAMGAGFISSLKDVGRFFADAAQWLVINLPVLLTMAAVIALGVFLAVKADKRKRRRKAQKEKAQAAEQTKE